MAIKYVKDFKHPEKFGFSGSAGKSSVKPHMRGGSKGNAAPVAPVAPVAPTKPVAPPRLGGSKASMAGKRK
jgi:hypothetical protein